ncbi:hypothetical protein ACFYNL_39340 [Streptomyces sp. NPDC007808]|uniref:hypothetical protein n=1 Tax=Streptomyces sp. NPDC007808 TaxID=3364779 RepID=UPI0036CCF7E8
MRGPFEGDGVDVPAEPSAVDAAKSEVDGLLVEAEQAHIGQVAGATGEDSERQVREPLGVFGAVCIDHGDGCIGHFPWQVPQV